MAANTLSVRITSEESKRPDYTFTGAGAGAGARAGGASPASRVARLRGSPHHRARIRAVGLPPDVAEGVEGGDSPGVSGVRARTSPRLSVERHSHRMEELRQLQESQRAAEQVQAVRL